MDKKPLSNCLKVHDFIHSFLDLIQHLLLFSHVSVWYLSWQAEHIAFWDIYCMTGRKIKYILWWQHSALWVWLLGKITAHICGYTSERHLQSVIWIDKLLFNLQHEMGTISFYAK